jgi:hypothetical protein
VYIREYERPPFELEIPRFEGVSVGGGWSPLAVVVGSQARPVQ